MSFTPPSSHTSGGLAFTGWTESGDPANVETNGGTLTATDAPDGLESDFGGYGLNANRTVGDVSSFMSVNARDGIASSPAGDNGDSKTCFLCDATNAPNVTTAVDCAGLTIVNLPTSDPGIAGGLYTTGGAVLVSAG